MLWGQHCFWSSRIFFGIITPECRLIGGQQYCSILLATKNIVFPKMLLHPVFNNLKQLIIFSCLVMYIGPTLLNVVNNIVWHFLIHLIAD